MSSAGSSPRGAEGGHTIERRDESLMGLVYFQSFMLGAVFAVGVWQALLINEISATAPIVLLHSFLAALYAASTAAVGVQTLRRGFKALGYLNVGLFLATALGGSAGLAYLAGASASTILMDAAMMTAVGFGMPAVALTYASVSAASGLTREPPLGGRPVLVYTALASASLHLIYGAMTVYAGLSGMTYYGHVAMGAVTGMCLLLAIGVSTKKGYAEANGLSRGNAAMLALALAFTILSGVFGALFVLGGPFMLVFAMAESSVLVYAFAFLSLGRR